MAEADTIDGTHGRPQGALDRVRRRRHGFKPHDLLEAAGQAGFNKMTIDLDGKITLEKGQLAADLPEQNGETNAQEADEASRER